MKLHSLQVVAFGPYAGTVSVDFDRLGADGLFLLHGDTGAGKTSLLDAVSFALFGSVPGTRQDAGQLRCDRADSRLETRVTLELTVGAHRLRISRTPKYERPKKNGTGTTINQASANLIWVGSVPAGTSPGGLDRIPEIAITVSDLLGMSAEQFFQVVLLPQGDFAKFLRSDTAHREQLLEQLFNTGRFSQIEDWFSEARRVSGAQVRQHQQTLSELVARLAQAAGQEPPTEGDAGWLADIRDRLADAAALAEQRRSHAASRLLVAEDDLRRSGDELSRMTKYRQLCAAWEAVQLAAPDRDRWRRELNAARRAHPLVVADRSRISAELRAATAASSAAAALYAVKALMTPSDVDLLPAALANPAGARAAGSSVRERAGTLLGLLDDALVQDSELRQLELQMKGVNAAAEMQRQLSAEQAGLPALIDVLTDQISRSRAAAGRLAELAERAQHWAALLLDAQRLPAAERARRRAVDDAQQATDRAQAMIARRLDLTRRRIEGMAAELAAGLIGGVACPVCGSAEHPLPAPGDGEVIAAADVDRAQQAEQRASELRERANGVRAEAEQAVALIEDRLNGRSAEELNAATAAVHRDLDEARQANTALPDNEQELQDLKLRADQLTTRLAEIAAATAARDSTIGQLTASTQRRARRLDEARAEHPNVSERRRHLLRLADHLDDLAGAMTLEIGAQADLVTAAQYVATVLSESGFVDLDAARSADAIDAEEVGTKLRKSEDQETAVTAQLADFGAADRGPAHSPPDSVDVPSVGFRGVEFPDINVRSIDSDDLAALEQRVAIAAARALDAREEASLAYAQASSALTCVAEVGGLAARLRVIVLDLEPKLAQDSELGAMTDLILGKGSNRLNMSLRAYVLAAWLKEVAVAANSRLKIMTGSRYSFVHSAGKESHGRSGGLGLDVLDEYSGKVRAAKTLSGGESFLASLALALGLADVVASESGAGLLNTMFIDEGFGTLDADTLDLVMETLDALRGEGRVIGVVSHVDELRQRIPSRLWVLRTPAGSSVQLNVA